MTDKELLALAAKAAGIRVASEPSYSEQYGIETYDGWSWNPLTDDGDALRLAVKLGIDIQQHFAHVSAWKPGHEEVEIDEGDCRYAATRRAIVRAAAEIGKGMP